MRGSNINNLNLIIYRDKRSLKWYIPIDQLEIFLDEYKSAKSDTELRHLREEVASLRGNLKRQTEENASIRNQQKIKKKLAEQVRIFDTNIRRHNFENMSN